MADAKATEFKVIDAAVKWMVKNRILACEDFAIVAAEEALTDKNIIEPMIGDGIEDMKGPGKRVAIKNWVWHREVYDAEKKAKPAPGESNVEAPRQSGSKTHLRATRCPPLSPEPTR